MSVPDVRIVVTPEGLLIPGAVVVPTPGQGAAFVDYWAECVTRRAGGPIRFHLPPDRCRHYWGPTVGRPPGAVIRTCVLCQTERTESEEGL